MKNCHAINQNYCAINENYCTINEKLSRNKWETCMVTHDGLSHTLFPWTRWQWLLQVHLQSCLKFPLINVTVGFSSAKTLMPISTRFSWCKLISIPWISQKKSKDIWVSQTKRKVLINDIIPLETISQAIANVRQ